MYAPQENCGVVIVFCHGFFALVLFSILCLQSSKLVTGAFLFGRHIPFFFSWPAVLSNLAFPFSKIMVVLYYSTATFDLRY